MKKICLFVVLYHFSFASSYSQLLFNGNCITCHEISTAKSAPSIIEIQTVYKNAFPQKRQFINYMANWVLFPNKESSLMQPAIEKYGLMPHLAYDKKVLKEIAAFLYEHSFKP